MLDSVNAWIPNAANTDYVIDTYHGLLDPANPYQLLPAYDDGDHLHPSKAGMTVIADLIYSGAKIIPNPLVDQYNIAHSTVTITPTLSDPGAIVTVNSQSIASGSTSANIPLYVGSNRIITKVTAQDGTTIKTYTINITGKPSSNANLANLYISRNDYRLKPLFSPDSTNYATYVDYDTTAISVRAYTMDATAKLSINGVPAISGISNINVNLNLGLNNIPIVVTAQDGITLKTYTLIINRIASSNDDLVNIELNNGLILSPAFTTLQTVYTFKIPSSMSSVTITPIASDPLASVTVNRQKVASGSPFTIPLKVASSTDSIIVISADRTTERIYRVGMLWQISNAALSGLKISGAAISPVFNRTVLNYTATSQTAFAVVTPTAVDSTATIQVNGVAVATGAASAPIPLAPGPNTITILVTARDGITTRTYTITVEGALENAQLLALTLSNATLTPVFTPVQASYTALVTNAPPQLR